VFLQIVLRGNVIKLPGEYQSAFDRRSKIRIIQSVDFNNKIIYMSKNVADKVTQARIIVTDTTSLLSDHFPVGVDLDSGN
jgi:endonuclease/exonuclease/phosphatase family metal-dependent hydrolase